MLRSLVGSEMCIRDSDKRSVLKFMGIVNYYRNHILTIAQAAIPLYELQKAYVRFKWLPEHQRAFDEVKKLLLYGITLAPIVPGKPFDLYTDASQVAIGAALLQGGLVVSFYSKHLTPPQQEYSATMREAYALVQSILYYRVYLIGSKFTVYTDHKPLTEWFTIAPLSPIYAKWIVKLQGLTFDVKYVEGEKNVLADMMSRPHDAARATLQQFHEGFKANVIQLQTEISRDSKLSLNVMQFVSMFDWIKAEQTSEVLTQYKIPHESVLDIDGVYYYNDEQQPRLIVPKTCTKWIVKIYTALVITAPEGP